MSTPGDKGQSKRGESRTPQNVAPRDSSSLGGRLTWARETSGFDAPVDAARAMGISRFTYAQHENGIRGFKRDSALQYARKFRVSLEWLLYGRGDPRPASKKEIPVTHYVGAGAAVFPFSDQGELERIPSFPGLEDAEAAIIRGDSMLPFQAGWIVVWRNQNDGVPEHLNGKLCIVAVKDGGVLLKVLRRERKRGFYTLESWNADPQPGTMVEWAAEIIDIRPR